MTEAIAVHDLANFLQKQLQGKAIVDSIEQMYQIGTSPAGKSREAIFIRHFLCPAISDFFYQQERDRLGLADEQICAGLGMEGYKTCLGFGFSPAGTRKHLFTKSLVIESEPPKAWFADKPEQVTMFNSCPDFAIRQPLLPSSIVGEVKYFATGSPEHAVHVLYDAARQAIFYLGAFTGEYHSAMIVVADGSREHNFFKGLQRIKPELLSRFGKDTSIHLVPIRLV